MCEGSFLLSSLGPQSKLSEFASSLRSYPINFLPDGKHFTYSAWGNEAYTGTYFASIDGRENKLVTNSTGNTAFSSGFLFYGLSTGSTVDLMAEAFDPAKGRVKGEPQLIVRGIEY